MLEFRLQLLELDRSVLVRSIARQSAFERTVGREELESKDVALDRRPLDALDLSDKNWEEKQKEKNN
jgi:hypothetical protein